MQTITFVNRNMKNLLSAIFLLAGFLFTNQVQSQDYQDYNGNGIIEEKEYSPQNSRYSKEYLEAYQTNFSTELSSIDNSTLARCLGVVIPLR